MSRQSITPSTYRVEGNIWGTIASIANELAPMTGPLLAAIGTAAEAIERAEQRNRRPEVEWMDE